MNRVIKKRINLCSKYGTFFSMWLMTHQFPGFGFRVSPSCTSDLTGHKTPSASSSQKTSSQDPSSSQAKRPGFLEANVVRACVVKKRRASPSACQCQAERGIWAVLPGAFIFPVHARWLFFPSAPSPSETSDISEPSRSTETQTPSF